MHLHDCPKEPMVPISLIVGSTFVMVIQLVVLCGCIQLCVIPVLLILIFLFCWLIAGSVFIYRAFQPNYESRRSQEYCEKTLYQAAFWCTNIAWVSMGVLGISKMCLFMLRRCVSEGESDCEEGGDTEKGDDTEKGGDIEKGGDTEKGDDGDKGGDFEKGSDLERGGDLERGDTKKGGDDEKGGDFEEKSDTKMGGDSEKGGDFEERGDTKKGGDSEKAGDFEEKSDTKMGGDSEKGGEI
ncbi:uncharacterized protein LOC134060558 isoform X2 [Sardina pilchardus]